MIRLAAAAVFVVCVGCAPHGLAAFVNRDLTKLNKSEAARFADLTDGLVEKAEIPLTEPRWIKPYRVGQSKWMLLSYLEAWSVPGSGTVQVTGFTGDWRPTFRSLFDTGYRLSPTSVKLMNATGIPQPVLSIHVDSLGPFVSINGGKAKPAFHPSTGIDLFCAFDEQGGYLIRLVDGNGPISNSYAGGFSSCGGPEVEPTQAKAWKAHLESDDPVRQLHAMMWLSSRHLNSKDWRKSGHARESVGSSRTFEILREDPEVLARLRFLQKSAAPWVREQSAYALRRLAQPLEPVEKPPF